MTAPAPTLLGLIPARAGSQRVSGKNVRVLRGHPLIAYTIAAARASGLCQRLIVSTDSEAIREIAVHYGAEAPFLRPAELATSTSPDIQFITHAFAQLPDTYDAFTLLRPTSPFRQADTIRRAWTRFLSLPGIDSLRAVERCHEHPGKMWVVDGDRMQPLLDQSHLEIPWHAGQYQALPEIYVQNSSLEIAWWRCVTQHRSREGKVLAPFLTSPAEGFSVDYEHDWHVAERMLDAGEWTLPAVDRPPFPMTKTLVGAGR